MPGGYRRIGFQARLDALSWVAGCLAGLRA